MTVSRRHVLTAGLAALALAGCSAAGRAAGPATTPRRSATMPQNPAPAAPPGGSSGSSPAPRSSAVTPSVTPSTTSGGAATSSTGSSPAAPSSGTAGQPSPPARRTPRQAELDQALRDAAWDNDVARARTLIKHGADVNAQDGSRQSAYLIATSEGHLELLRLCLAHGADVNAKDSWNGTGLIRAAERGHAQVVGELLRAGIDRDHVNRIGYQAIHEAVWFGQDTADYHDTVRILAAGGVRLDRASQGEGLTPLDMARAKRFPAMTRILETLATAAKPATPNTALLRAAESGDADRVALAIRSGAGLETRNGRRRTPLLLAAVADRLPAARVLAALGADVNAIDDQSDTPVLVTGVTGSPAMLEVLLPHHPDFGIYNRYGGTALIPASERGHVAYVRRAVTTGIDINHVNNLGWTALLEAVILGNGGKDHQEVVRILLANGADRSIPDGNGVTALQHAEAKGHRAIARLLAGR